MYELSLEMRQQQGEREREGDISCHINVEQDNQDNRFIEK